MDTYAILERHLVSGAASLDAQSEADGDHFAEHDRAVRRERPNRRIIANRALNLP